MRTDALLDYLVKIINDPTYEPQTAYEQSFEQEIMNAHNVVQARVKNGEFDDISPDTEMNYQEQRIYYACEILYQMNEKYIIKED